MRGLRPLFQCVDGHIRMLAIATGRLVRRGLDETEDKRIARKRRTRAPGGAGGKLMRVLFVHPSPLMYSELYLRLEPLGLERVASAIRSAGHEVRLLDLQIFPPADYWHEIDTWAPQAVGFSVNYLANVPEVVDLAKET